MVLIQRSKAMRFILVTYVSMSVGLLKKVIQRQLYQENLTSAWVTAYETGNLEWTPQRADSLTD